MLLREATTQSEEPCYLYLHTHLLIDRAHDPLVTVLYWCFQSDEFRLSGSSRTTATFHMRDLELLVLLCWSLMSFDGLDDNLIKGMIGVLNIR